MYWFYVIQGIKGDDRIQQDGVYKKITQKYARINLYKKEK